jgi:Tfp pilus assembly protein PilW
MQLNPANPQPKRRQLSGVTLLELMVAISVLTFIILGLYSMFDRTQKAFLGSMTEVELQDSGRAFTLIMTRDLEQMQPSGLVNRTNLYIAPILVNNSPIAGFNQYSMMGSNLFTNVVQEFFFLTHTSYWNGIAYLMQPISTNANDVMLFTNLGVGALYRYSTNVNDFYHKSTDLFAVYTNSSAADSQRMTEGVVHMELRPYDRNGNYMNPYTTQFTNSVVPAYVELEVAVLEPKVLLQARSIPNAAAQKNFIQETTNRASAVHIYRSYFPVRAAN